MVIVQIKSKCWQDHIIFTVEVSMENIMFKNYDLEKFIDRYLMQINYIPIPSPEVEKHALVFNAKPLFFPETFTRTPTAIVAK